MRGGGRDGGVFIRIKNNDQGTGFKAVTAKLSGAFAADQRRLAEKRVDFIGARAQNVAQQKNRSLGLGRRLRRGDNRRLRGAGAGGGAQKRGRRKP